VEFYSAFGDVEFAGDFFVGKILQERIEDFLFAAAEIGDGIGLQAAGLAGKDGVHETGKNGARNPKAASGDQRQRADELIAGFGIGENAFYAETEQGEAVGILMGFADDDESRIGIAFENIGEQSAGSLASGVGVNDVDLSFGRFERAEIGSESGFELLADDFEIRLGKNAFELAQHQRVRREQADGELSCG